jgi:hypothetical protein
MEPTPLLCMLVCTYIHKDIKGESDMYGEIINFFWRRGVDELPEGTCKHPEALKEKAREVLRKKSLEAIREREIVLDLSTNESGVPNSEIDFLIYKTGIVQTARIGKNLERVTCRFIHDSFLEYHAALELCHGGEKQISKNFETAVTLHPGERKVLLFAGSTLKDDPKLWRAFVKVLAKKFLEKFGDKEKEISEARAKSHAVRLQWRKETGMDLCIEVVSLLDEADSEKREKWDASDCFMDTLMPKALRKSAHLLAKAVSDSVQRTFAPVRYRLMLEPAAKFGNMCIVKRLEKHCGVTPEERLRAYVAASASKRGKAASDFYVDKLACSVTLKLCCEVCIREERGEGVRGEGERREVEGLRREKVREGRREGGRMDSNPP